MGIELQILGLAVVWAVVQLGLFAVPANLEIGSRWLAGPRDEPPEEWMSKGTARLQRAFLNHIEGLVLHTAATVVVVMGGATGPLTAWGAGIYLAARIAYVPCYWTGVRYLRSAVWAVGLLGTLIMLGAGLVTAWIGGWPSAAAGG
ncbi:MAG: MAPEG family protein [Pseudomonadota bacterium]